MDYHILMGTFKLSEIEETDYDGPTPITVRTDLSYNPVNLLVSQSTKQNSDNKILKTVNKYAIDYTNGSYGADLLKSKSMNDVVLEKTEYSNDQVISKEVTNYADFNGLIKPSLIQKLSKSTQLLEDRIHFNGYDYFGNLLGLNDEGGMKTCYLWGYNNQYPIAEIKNADYASVVQILGGSSAVNLFASKLSPSKTDIDTFLLPIRNNQSILKDAQIKTFIYRSLVGMTSQTDPKGQTTYYEYDGFQRLKNVKDQNQNIIKNTIYHYQP